MRTTKFIKMHIQLNDISPSGETKFGLVTRINYDKIDDGRDKLSRGQIKDAINFMYGHMLENGVTVLVDMGDETKSVVVDWL